MALRTGRTRHSDRTPSKRSAPRSRILAQLLFQQGYDTRAALKVMLKPRAAVSVTADVADPKSTFHRYLGNEHEIGITSESEQYFELRLRGDGGQGLKKLARIAAEAQASSIECIGESRTLGWPLVREPTSTCRQRIGVPAGNGARTYGQRRRERAKLEKSAAVRHSSVPPGLSHGAISIVALLAFPD